MKSPGKRAVGDQTRILSKVDIYLAEHDVRTEAPTDRIHPEAHKITRLYRTDMRFRELVDKAVDEIIEGIEPGDIFAPQQPPSEPSK